MRSVDVLLTGILTAVAGLIDPVGSARPGFAWAQTRQPPAAFAGYAELPGVHLWYVDSGGGGVPRSVSSTHLPRRTGEVRLG